jgi:hypothetical protein
MKTLQVIIITLLLVSCKKETPTVNETVNEIKASTEVVAKEGTGKITLTCNGQTLTAEGVCGVLVSMGQLTIAVKDIINPAKVFTVSFNDENFPTGNKDYTVKSKDYLAEGKQPDNEVSVSFTEGLPNNKMNVWDSENAKGTIRFVQNGNEIKCILKDIQLSPAKMFNADDLQEIGTVSGEFTFYKN